jgi:hypothetical protein
VDELIDAHGDYLPESIRRPLAAPA